MDHTTTHPTGGIPLVVVQHTLWHFGDRGLGVQPGTFSERLLLLISAADAENRRKLWASFPDYSLAFDLATSSTATFELLRNRAKDEGVRDASGDHCLLRTIDGEPCAVHYDGKDFADGTVTSVITGKRVEVTA